MSESPVSDRTSFWQMQMIYLTAGKQGPKNPELNEKTNRSSNRIAVFLVIWAQKQE